jgi:hypothetical protein
MVAGMDFQAGGVAAEFVCRRSGFGISASHTPKSH